MSTLRRHPRLHPLVIALAVAALPACTTSECLPLTPGGSQGAALWTDAAMNVRFGGSASAPLHLDLYRNRAEATRPLAVVLRGGEGTIGKRSSYVGQLVEVFAEAGYVVATPDRRPDAKDGGRDVRQALRFLTQCHAAALGVDPYRTVLVAEDSAVPIALNVANELLELRRGRFAGAPAAPAAVVLVGGRFENAADPAVPTWIVHGTADREVPLEKARGVCARANGSCEVFEVPDGIHRAENWWPSRWDYKARVIKALEPLLHARPPSSPMPPAPSDASPTLLKRVVYDDGRRLALDAWLPDGPGPHPVVVVAHGGGWEAGDRVTYVTPLLDVVAAQGMAWVSIDYRLTPEVVVDEQVDDVGRALEYLRTHAARLRIDAKRMVLAGESASGHLVAQYVSTRPQDTPLAGVLSFYGVYDLEAMAGDPADPRSLARRLFRMTALDDAARVRLRGGSPLHTAQKGVPPMYLVAGTADGLIAQQRAYAARLRAVGATVDTFEVEGAPHGMESWNDTPAWREWESRVATWLQRTTGVR